MHGEDHPTADRLLHHLDRRAQPRGVPPGALPRRRERGRRGRRPEPGQRARDTRSPTSRRSPPRPISCVPPEQRASFVVRQLLTGMLKPLQADVVHEESITFEQIDLYYRPWWAFEFHWKVKDKKGVVELDAVTGEMRNSQALMARLSRIGHARLAVRHRRRYRRRCSCPAAASRSRSPRWRSTTTSRARPCGCRVPAGRPALTISHQVHHRVAAFRCQIHAKWESGPESAPDAHAGVNLPSFAAARAHPM